MKPNLTPANKVIQKKILDSIGSARRPREVRLRYKTYIFLVCMVLSIFIWSLVRLGHDYIYTAEYHLRFRRLPESLRLASASDSVISVSIRVQGFDFFTERFFRNRARYIDLDLHNTSVHYLDNHQTGYLLTSSFSGEIANQTDFPLEINSIYPDTLYLNLERKAGKRISPMKQGTLPPGHLLGKGDTVRLQIDTIPNKKVNQEKPKNKKK
ncbi:MAG: hypothetical protein WCL00_08380 [Bacteroidota bacterium]